MLERGRSDGGLGKLLDEAVDKIRKTLFSEACFANPSTRFQRTVQTEEGLIFPLLLDSSQRITQVPETVVRTLLGAFPYDVVRGVTLYEVGKILLSENQWCIETLIHEVLHSLSIFAVRTDVGQHYRLMVDGLTECLTEHVLSRYHAGTYNSCLRAKGTYCTLTYPYETKIWCALASVIGYDRIVPIYFWTGRTDWETIFDEFAQAIRKAGYPKFENVLKAPGKLAVMARLHQECGRRIGAIYGKAYRQLSERYD